jgi:putative sterol carrier protein
MALKYPSLEWMQELEQRLNASESYAQAAAMWEGDCIFVVQADANYPETSYGYINLQHGKASNSKQMKSLDEQKALFTMSAPMGTWRKVMEGRLDPIQAMFSGKIKVVGSMAQIQRTPKATYELTRIASEIDTDFGY